MGRHSAGDDDGTDVRLAAPALEAPGARGRHLRDEDAEASPDSPDSPDSPATPDSPDSADTGPVDPAAVRAAVAPGVAQDDQPTERIQLAELIAAAEEDAEASPHAGETAVDTPDEAPLELTTIFDQADQADQASAPPTVAPAKPPAAPRPARGNQSTAADLELLRKHPDVRARVIAAAVVPFVLYAAVLLLIGATAVQFLIFIWIPMVSAGVLAGLFLDAAHRRAKAAPEAHDPPDAER